LLWTTGTRTVVRIVTDSTGDIPAEIVEQLGIVVVPLHIQIGDETYRDGMGLAVDRVYHELVQGQRIPRTSAPSPGDFVKVYRELADETDSIISIHLSPGYSGTFEAASLAGGYVRDKCRVEVVDSNTVSVGLGLIVTAAARAAREGKSTDEILDIIRHVVSRTRVFGKVDDFAYLFRGKRFRLTWAMAALGRVSMALGIKLLGEAYGGGRLRSPLLVIGQSMALAGLRRRAGRFPVKEIAIAYSTAPGEAEMLAKRLEPLVGGEHIMVARLGCVTSTYVGPGTLVMALVY